MEFRGIKIEWLGHASFRLTHKELVYIDPFQLRGEQEKADIILITHSHYDHCSLKDIQKILKQATVIFGPVDVQSKVAKLGEVEFKMLHPGDTSSIGELSLQALPAYNIGKPFHPKGNGWLGYLCTIDGVRILHAGDTDAVPELLQLKGIDVMLLPVGGTYTMNAEEAARLANKVMPAVAVPMHWGSIVGSQEDAKRFKQLSHCQVELLGNL